uniref:Uncharacterized protein n=1 Tax=Anguilla anguilla TaxID=7936 RepID=A0A0E9U2X6_ANGAN
MSNSWLFSVSETVQAKVS